ncbi:DNA-binding transcriptional MerR regulator [Rathayibacter sp. PhB152]|uniref:MerR family transcriptional regulator n=1 Tax=Rathayibacter sp. PhB152 TaxID=2485190 RepID=UPI000F4B2CFA|nr:MerR family transcriptional regulator [Rathayibacter sp. PhB152]ROQ60396.1 DNA-binding transcriptional MerR regulator [Rathayibacter sp. PhB152]
MRIGELSKRTGVAPRMLRYYEEQNLITPRRLDNGYREYDDYLIDRVRKIRGLIDAGVPTRIVTNILPCLGQPQTIVVENADPALYELLETERDRMNEKIAFLTQNRDALSSYLQALELAGLQIPTSKAS